MSLIRYIHRQLASSCFQQTTNYKRLHQHHQVILKSSNGPAFAQDRQYWNISKENASITNQKAFKKAEIHQLNLSSAQNSTCTNSPVAKM